MGETRRSGDILAEGGAEAGTGAETGTEEGRDLSGWTSMDHQPGPTTGSL